MSKCYSTRRISLNVRKKERKETKEGQLSENKNKSKLEQNVAVASGWKKKEVSSITCAEQTHCFGRFRRSNAKQLSSKKHRNRLNYV